MGITLRSLGGDTEFDGAFIEQIPELESEMIAHDLDPSDFVIEKRRSVTQPLPMLIATEPLPVVSYDYTVGIQEDAFTVTLNNDANFLEYFRTLCFSPDEKPQENSMAQKLGALLKRAEKWLEEDSFKE